MPKRARIRARLDPVEDGWRRIQRERRSRTLPPPGPAAVATAITILEVRAGLRPPHQLEKASHYTLWSAWPLLANPPGADPVPIVPRPLAVTVRGLAPGLVDATVVIEFGGRTHALALRLDGAPGFWQLLELDYPTKAVVGPAIAHPEPLGRPAGPAGDIPHPGEHDRPRQHAHDPVARPAAQPPPTVRRDPGESLGIELE